MTLKRFWLFFPLFIFVWNNSYSQDYSLILKPEDGSSMQDAHIIVYSDSIYQKSFFSEVIKTNQVQFTVADTLKCFYVFVSHINYYQIQKKICRPFKFTDTIALYKKTNVLDEIVLEGIKKTKISVKGNVAEIRPGKIITKAKVKTVTILKSIPDIFVLPGSDIKIRGQNVRNIFIHAKVDSPGLEISKSELKEIDVNLIEKIVAFYNEREIHIYLKKPDLGYKADVNLYLNKGKHFYEGIDPDFSISKEKSIFWLNTDFGIIKQTQNSYAHYMSTLNNQSFLINSKSDNYTKTKYFKISLLYERDISKSGVFGFRARYKTNKNLTDTDVISSTVNTLNKGLTSSDYNLNSFTTSAYYKNKLWQKWDIVLKTGYLISKQKNKSNSTFNYNANNTTILGSQLLEQDNDSKAFTYEIDLEKKISEETSVKFKVNQEILKTNSTTYTFQKIINNTIPDSTFTNNIYDSSLYFKLKFKTTVLKKVLLNITPEMVFYSQSNKDETLRELFQYSKNYFIPSFSLSIPIKKDKYLSIFGNQTIRNVDLKNLVYNTQSYDGFVNNENNNSLKPALYTQIGFSFPLINNLNTSIYYTKGENTLLNYPLFTEEGIFLGNRKINLDKNNVLGLSLFYSKNVGKKIYLSSSLNISDTSLSGVIETNTFQVSYTNLLFNQMLYYTINDSWTSYIDFTYMSKQKLSDLIGMKSNAFINLGITKKFKKYFELSFTLDDVFNSYTPSFYSLNEAIPYNSKINFDHRVATISLNYTLNKEFKKRSKTKDVLKSLNKRTSIKEK